MLRLYVVFLLLITRVPQFGLKALLQKTTPRASAQLGSLGLLSVSAALVLKLENIGENENVNWAYQTLYVPALLPFLAVSTLVLSGCSLFIQLRPLGAGRAIGNSVSLDNRSDERSIQDNDDIRYDNTIWFLFNVSLSSSPYIWQKR
jgi:hypothetical protein